MPLPTNYSELKAQVADWLIRDDLTNQISEFIGLAELRFNRELRVPRMERNTTEPIVQGGTRVQLPDDFLEARAVWISGSPTKRLDPVQPDEVYSKWSLGGRPEVFSVVGSSTSYLDTHFDFFVLYQDLTNSYAFRVLPQSGNTFWSLPADNDSWDFQTGDRIVFEGDGGEDIILTWEGFLSSPPPYGWTFSPAFASLAELREKIGDRYGKVERQGIGMELIIGPVPNDASTLNLIYFSKVPALSDSNTSNWLLAEAPDLYLYGSLLAASPYLKDDARIPVWQSEYATVIEMMRRQSDKSRYSGGQLVMRHDLDPE